MRQRTKARKAAKTRRRRVVEPRGPAKIGRHRKSANVDTAERIGVLEHRLNEALQQQTATADVLKVISRSAFNLQTVLDTLVKSAVRLCEADSGILRTREGDIYPVAATCRLAEQQRDRFARYSTQPDRGSLFGRAILEGRTIHVSDVLADPEYDRLRLRDLVTVRAGLAVPMMRDGTVVGVVTLQRKEPRPFSDSQIQLVTTFADQAVIAIENVRLFEAEQQRTHELRESLEQQTATADVLKVISRSPGELKPVFEAMLASAVRICGAKFGNLWLCEGNTFRVNAMHGAPPAYADFLRRNSVIHSVIPGTALGRIVSERQAIQIPDAENEKAYAKGTPFYTGTIEFARARTIIAVPLLKDEELVGAIVIFRQEVRPFTERQIELLTNFAAQAVIAIENTRLLNELRESLAQQTATADVLKAISSSLDDLTPVFETIGQRAEKLCDAEISLISMVDGDLIRLVSISGVTEKGVETVRQVYYPMRRSDETVAARAIRSGAICHVPDVLSDPLYPSKEAARVAGFRGCLAVPMVRDEQVIGAIFVARREAGLFTDAQVQLLKTFAAQAVIAIENVRLFNETKEALERQTATADVLKVISRSTFDLQTVLDTLVASAARLCEADSASIHRPVEGSYPYVASYGLTREYDEYMRERPLVPGRGTVLGRAITELKPIQVNDVTADPEYTLTEGRRLGGFRTVLGVPLLREGVPIGIIMLTRNMVRPFTDKQIELVSTFADQAAIAIENVRLFESVEARTRELAASLEELRTTQDRLVQTQKLALLGQLTAGIAHEIKNPLNFVNNFSGISAELIDELRDALKGVPLDDKGRAEIEELTDTLKSNFDKVVHHGRRADAIVKSMLQHSREGSGEHRVIDINALVEESLNLAWHGARAETQGFEIKFKQSFDPSAGGADVFPQDIRRALLNLIANGFYAATKRRAETNGGDYEPTLTASTRNLGDRVEIRIRDNGNGIAPDVKEKMFEPFFTTKPTGEGTGLGLSISHDVIVKQHAGTIEVDTQPGEFTEIRIVLLRTPAFV